jgi:hypothetical protein
MEIIHLFQQSHQLLVAVEGEQVLLQLVTMEALVVEEE